MPVIATHLILINELYHKIMTATAARNIIKAVTIAHTYILAMVPNIPLLTNIGANGYQYFVIKP